MILQDDICGRIKLAQAIQHKIYPNADWLWEDKELQASIGIINKLCSLEETFIAVVKSFFINIPINDLCKKVELQRFKELIEENKDFREKVLTLERRM